MALSPSHKFGQIIGEILEKAMIKYLQEFADKNNLYLDTIGERPARSGKKVTWVDDFGNKHDLDFVLERGGTDTEIGTPVAFIEIAWRRYTKHSRNKAQEIQGAILPLATKHSFSAPFLGVILAGVFTEGAINQLKSRNFEVLYFEYETVKKAFEFFALDASFDEDTSGEEFDEKITNWNNFQNKEEVIDKLIELNQEKVDAFFNALQNSVDRFIKEIRILPLFGSTKILKTIKEALIFFESNEFTLTDDKKKPIRFEIKIVYSNDDKIEASFANPKDAISFLSNYKDPVLSAE